jgi:hypothetical protein
MATTLSLDLLLGVGCNLLPINKIGSLFDVD